MLGNKERAEKQLLTVNSVNPNCSSALDIFFKTIYSLFSFPKRKSERLIIRMLTKDVEKKEGFTTSADASDNLYHPIAFGRDELI